MLVNKKDRRAAARPGAGGIERVATAVEREGAGCLVPRRGGAISRQMPTTPKSGTRSTTSSRCRSIRARPMHSCLSSGPNCKWPADVYLEGSDQHRGWFKSWLMKCLRHARARALRGGAHPWLRARRGRPQDVEVARQRVPAGRDQAVGRRYIASLGRRHGLYARICGSGRKSSRPCAKSTGGCATRCVISRRARRFRGYGAARTGGACRSSSRLDPASCSHELHGAVTKAWVEDV